MTLEALVNSLPFVLNLIVFGTYIIGLSAVIFGFYDLIHLKWTGDLKVMVTALLSCTTILIVCAILKQSSIVGNIMLAAYFFTVISLLFFKQQKNPKLNHEPRPRKSLRQTFHF